ncbi:THUMP domain-containing protein [Guyparkeria sp. GHLCS8-2]|uniref:tRNA sulfurtransferase n=1 Tax=Guyparkeria halopsychrophila TaxID=3139421 RepID=UPI0037C7B7CC
MTKSDWPELIIVRPAPEMQLKSSRTRRRFRNILMGNLRVALDGVAHELRVDQGRLLLFTREPEAAAERLERVFGVASYSPVEAVVEPTVAALVEAARTGFAETVRGRTYAVRCKRHGGAQLSTREVERQVGAVLNPFGTVNLDRPDVRVEIDLVEAGAWVFTRRQPGPGGVPLGVQDRAVTLMSGGFDSAVAAWYTMRRGVGNDYVFCNLGGATHENMVTRLSHRLAGDWAIGDRPRLFVVDFLPVVADMRERLPGEVWQVVLKRLMYRAGEAIARRTGAQALVTGEALSQVSSQTLSNLNSIDTASELLVLRPLIGFDKSEIMTLARRIGTYQLSEGVPEFCALSNSKPLVSSRRGRMEREEAQLDETLLERAVAEAREIDLAALTEEELTEPDVLADVIPADAQIIDCQPPRRFRDWHLPGAVNYPPDELARRFESLPRDRPYLLYCLRGANAPLLAERMQRAGFDARAFRGGVSRLRRAFDRGDPEVVGAA